MSHIYAMNKDKTTTALIRVNCKNEDEELQTVLEKNLALIPGDQITPDGEPRRWMLVKREMPVPDPTNGGNRWSIDFFMADQDAMPTFVECKRHDDTRARREVVGQMLDYVANGAHYWNWEEIKEHAVQSSPGRSIESMLSSLSPMLADDIDIDTYFKTIEANLREGKVRMVFLLEDSSYELRSIVEFLNGQMDRAEVLLVEVRQYQLGEQRIVVPTLFGFTERARMAKRDTSGGASRSGKRTTISEEIFYEELAGNTGQQTANELKQFMERLSEIEITPSFGSSSLNLRSFPGGTKKMNFGSVRKNGTVDTDPANWATGQINRPDIGEKYQEALATISDGKVLKTKNGNGFTIRVVRGDGAIVTLGDLLKVKDQWFDLIVRTQDELNKAVREFESE